MNLYIFELFTFTYKHGYYTHIVHEIHNWKTTCRNCSKLSTGKNEELKKNVKERLGEKESRIFQFNIHLTEFLQYKTRRNGTSYRKYLKNFPELLKDVNSRLKKQINLVKGKCN